jgi:hypothetical protein
MRLAIDVEDELAVPVEHVPGARGHFVLAVGANVDDAEALAVWRLGPTGRPVGAWVIRFGDMVRKADHLNRVIGGQRGRCLVDWNSDIPAAALDKIARHLPATLIRALAASIVVIPDLLKEISEYRQRYTDAVESHRSTNKSKIVALSWAREVPGDPDTARQVLTAHRQSAASPVAGEAIRLAGALERAIDLWQDTEQVRYRRSYLRSFGEPQSLPPLWLTNLRAAAQGLTQQN